jgi:hypothetical protein
MILWCGWLATFITDNCEIHERVALLTILLLPSIAGTTW